MNGLAHSIVEQDTENRSPFSILSSSASNQKSILNQEMFRIHKIHVRSGRALSPGSVDS